MGMLKSEGASTGPKWGPASQKLFQLAVEAAPNGMIMVDESGNIVMANTYAEKLFGYSKDDLIGRSIDLLVPERFRDSHPGHRRAFSAEPHARPMGTGRDLYGVRRDGEEVPVEIGLNPLTTEDGSFVLASVIDISERKRAEERVRQLNAELERRAAELLVSNKELESFSYSVSHDLRTPLRAIDGFSRMLLEDHADKLDAEGRRLIDVVRQNTRLMGKLIDDLLEFSRLGRKPMTMSRVDMTALARSALAEILAACPGRKIEPTLGVLPPAWCDQGLVRQVLLNLLSNAAKYSRTRAVAHIEVGGREEGEENVYYVRDDGVGFDMEYVDKLFGTFQRLHSVEEFEGTGVGLALVQRIVHRHGGRVWAQGKPDGGATFHFSLRRGGADDGP